LNWTVQRVAGSAGAGADAAAVPEAAASGRVAGRDVAPGAGARLPPPTATGRWARQWTLACACFSGIVASSKTPGRVTSPSVTASVALPPWSVASNCRSAPRTPGRPVGGEEAGSDGTSGVAAASCSPCSRPLAR